MSSKSRTLSITRPDELGNPNQTSLLLEKVGIGLVTGSLMLLMAFLVLSAVIATWVSDLHGSEAGNLSLLGRVTTYEAWLLPAAVGAIALTKFGIAVILASIIRNLWLRVESVKQALPALISGASNR